MRRPDAPEAGPSIERVEAHFPVYEIRTDGDRLEYYGDPRGHPEGVVRELWPAFREDGYEIRMTRQHGEFVLVAEPVTVGVDGVPWTNVILLAATVASTLFAGAFWYYIDPFTEPWRIWQAWPFVAAILVPLGIHELGHYAMSRYHRVQASLPYFLPVPTLIGTMGAVIKMEGRMPDRRALFDIGVAGPLAGLVAAIVVAVIGLHLPPLEVPSAVLQDPDAVELRLGYPPLLEALAALTGQPLYYDDPGVVVNPVVIGAWVGLLVTFLNLIPVGQLDGGHMTRAMLGPVQETLGALMPGVLFGLAAYLHFWGDYGFQAVGIWLIWGVFSALLAFVGPAQPIDDDGLGWKRQLLGVLTFLLGALCFIPVPVEIVEL